VTRFSGRSGHLLAAVVNTSTVTVTVFCDVTTFSLVDESLLP
jgi:hypothetical protein